MNRLVLNQRNHDPGSIKTATTHTGWMGQTETVLIDLFVTPLPHLSKATYVFKYFFPETYLVGSGFSMKTVLYFEGPHAHNKKSDLLLDHSGFIQHS